MFGSPFRGLVPLALTLIATSACALRPGTGQAAAPQAGGGGQAGAGQAQGRQQGPRAYDRVITDRAVSRDGLFRTHRLGDTLYFEIPVRSSARTCC